MALIDQLLDSSQADRELLHKNLSLGDQPDIVREIDFQLILADTAKAELLRDFINDNHYGEASVEEGGERIRVVVRIVMAPQGHTLCAVSGLMVCLCRLFDAEYDGWGCVLKRA
jgi:regulator of RNase E activity RraB